jgi:hypothetical protein
MFTTRKALLLTHHLSACRRRRIKCDEGKPTCNNCIKSKRDCEGYSQRLTFKEPLGQFPSGHLYGHPVYHRQAQEALVNAQISAAQTKTTSSQGPLAVIAPKPPPVDYSGAGPLSFGHGYGGPSVAGTPAVSQPHPQPHPHHLPSPPFLGLEARHFPDPPYPTAHPELSAGGDLYGGPAAPVHGFQPSPSVGDQQPIFFGHHGPVSGPEQSLASPESGDGGFYPPASTEDDYWQSDDEASMASSDDAMPDSHAAHLESNDLGIQVARRLEPLHDLYGVGIRSFAGPANDNILDAYTPSSDSSPLNDSHTAAIFWYFVNVTGQSMSLYERHPFDPTPMFQGHPVPKQRQHIWTCQYHPHASFTAAQC